MSYRWDADYEYNMDHTYTVKKIIVFPWSLLETASQYYDTLITLLC
jgi:hypothetical protein